MAAHRPGTIWSFYGPGKLANSWVRTANTQAVDITLWGTVADVDKVAAVTVLRLSRREARLLSRRLAQCLDDTKGRR